MKGEANTRSRADGPPRHRAAAAFVALALVGLAVAASGKQIGLEDRGPGAPPEGATADADAQALEFLVIPEEDGTNAEALLESILVELRCLGSQQRWDKKPAGRPGLGENVFSASELAALFQPPEVYRSGIDPEHLRSIAARMAGADDSGNLDGSRATVHGVPPPLAVAGWGSPGAPLLAYVPRAETPVDLEPDMSGAGVLVVDGDLNVWGAFRYAGLLVVLGDLAVMDDAEFSVEGLPLLAGELKVFHGGRFLVKARKLDFTLIRKTFHGQLPIRRLPVPQFERVDAANGERGCAFFGPGM